MSTKELRVLINDNPIGSVHQDVRGNFGFIYDDAYREHAAAVPLSLSMPLMVNVIAPAGTKQSCRRQFQNDVRDGHRVKDIGIEQRRVDCHPL
jgi:HipA-like protein